MPWILEPNTETDARHRGARSLGRGLAFQQGYAVACLVELLDSRTELRAVRYDSVQDIDLLYHDAGGDRQVGIQLKNEAVANYTLNALKDVLISFMRDLLNAGLKARLTFHLVASGTTNTADVMRIRDGVATAADIAVVAGKIAEELPSFSQLDDCHRLEYTQELFARLTLDFNRGDNGSPHRPFEADAALKLQRFGIAAEDTDNAISILRDRLEWNRRFHVGDVRTAIGPLLARAAVRPLRPQVDWVTRERARALNDEEILEYYAGRRINWSFIASDGDLPRDQAEELLELARPRPDKLRIVTVVGSPGAGKSTLAWRAAWTLASRNVPVLHIQDRAANSIWDELPVLHGKLNQPFLVLVDDIFRIEGINFLLRALPPALPMTILATSRANEYRQPDLDGDRKRLDITPPTDAEIDRTLERFSLPPSHLGARERNKLQNPGEFLALLMHVSQGRQLDEYVASTMESLARSDPELPAAYATLSLAGSADLALPKALLLRLNPDKYHDLEQRDATRRIIYPGNREGYIRVGHALIATAAVNYYAQRLNPINLFQKLLEAIDPSVPDERATIIMLLRHLSAGTLVDLSSLRNILPKFIEEKFCAVSEYITASNIFDKLKWKEESRKFKEASLKADVSSGEDLLKLVDLVRRNRFDDAIVLSRFFDFTLMKHAEPGLAAWLSFLMQKGSSQQIKMAIAQTSQWLERNPTGSTIRRVFLRAVEHNDSQEELYKSLSKTAEWLDENPEEEMVRKTFINIIERRCSSDIIFRVINSTEDWLSRSHDSINVRISYLGMVERKGTLDQVQKAITATEDWLDDHHNDSWIRAAHIRLIHSRGSPEQACTILEKTSHWIANHQEIGDVGSAYLKLAEGRGNPDQITLSLSIISDYLVRNTADIPVRQTYVNVAVRTANPQDISDILDQTRVWLDEHQDDAVIRSTFIGHMERLGSAEKNIDTIRDTIRWLANHPEDTMVRAAFLASLGRQGTSGQISAQISAQISLAIDTTDRWLAEHQEDIFTRSPHLKLVEAYGNPQQITNLLESTADWLERRPDDSAVRASYLCIACRKGSQLQSIHALSNIEKWLDLHPADTHVRQQYLTLVGQYGAAVQVTEAISKNGHWLNNGHENATVRAAYLNLVDRKGSPQQLVEALASVTHWLRRTPDDTYLRVTYLKIISRKGTFEQINHAIDETFDILMSYKPKSSKLILATLISMAFYLRDRTVSKKVVNIIEENFHGADGLDKESYIFYAHLLFRSGEYLLAENIGWQTLDSTVDNSVAYAFLAKTIFEQGRLDEAEKLYQQAISCDEENVLNLSHHLICLYAMQRQRPHDNALVEKLKIVESKFIDKTKSGENTKAKYIVERWLMQNKCE